MPAKRLAAVLGTGQTKHATKRLDVSMAGLCREAIDRAMADAGVDWPDIDAVVMGKAPDLFEGVMMPELFLADSLGATGKPLLRVHTAGSVGGSTANVAASLVQAGVHRRVLAVAWEKQSESNAMWALSVTAPFSVSVNAGAGGYFAPHIRAYIRRSGAPEHIGAMVAVKDRRNGARNPFAHLQQPDITLESVQAGRMLWDPVRFDESCPSSDGAAAMVIGDEIAADDLVASGREVAWIRATVMRTEPTTFAERDQVNPRAGREAAAALWQRAGITDPLSEVDIAEIYVPFSWFEPMWLENLGFAAEGQGWKLTEAGETEIGGRLPVNPSGGVLSSNPIGASGMLRFGEAAAQVMHRAGDHQVDGARTALGHAYGGGSQFFAMWLVGSGKPE
jgi:acetyl-CoA C-acetyltransferase